MTLALISGLITAPAWAQTPDAARVGEALAYLRVHANELVSPPRLTDLQAVAKYTAIAGTLTSAVALVALKSAQFPNAGNFFLSYFIILGAGVGIGSTVVYGAMLPFVNPDQHAQLVEMRRRKRAVRRLLSQPFDRVQAEFNADPAMAEWIVQLADNLRAQDQLWIERPMAAAPR